MKWTSKSNGFRAVCSYIFIICAAFFVTLFTIHTHKNTRTYVVAQIKRKFYRIRVGEGVTVCCSLHTTASYAPLSQRISFYFISFEIKFIRGSFQIDAHGIICIPAANFEKRTAVNVCECVPTVQPTVVENDINSEATITSTTKINNSRMIMAPNSHTFPMYQANKSLIAFAQNICLMSEHFALFLAWILYECVCARAFDCAVRSTKIGFKESSWIPMEPCHCAHHSI